MVALTRSSLPWVPHTWMSGTDPLQTPRAWFWGTHKWAITAALLADGVSRTVGNVLEVFRPILLRWLFSLQWPVPRWKMMVCCCFGSWWCASWFGLYPPVLQWKMAFLLCIDKSFDFSVGRSFSIPYFVSWSIPFPLMPVWAGIHWRTTQVVWPRVLMFSVSFFCVVSGSPDMGACRADSESVRKIAFLGFSSHEMMVSVAFSNARTSAL